MTNTTAATTEIRPVVEFTYRFWDRVTNADIRAAYRDTEGRPDLAVIPLEIEVTASFPGTHYAPITRHIEAQWALSYSTIDAAETHQTYRTDVDRKTGETVPESFVWQARPGSDGQLDPMPRLDETALDAVFGGIDAQIRAELLRLWKSVRRIVFQREDNDPYRPNHIYEIETRPGFGLGA